MTDRAQPGAIDSLIRNDELAQVFGRFSEGFIVPGNDPTPAAQRRGDIDETAFDAFSLTTSPTSLDVTVAPGEAFISGWVCRDVSTTLTLPANSTVDIVVGFDPDAIFDPTPPMRRLLILPVMSTQRRRQRSRTASRRTGAGSYPVNGSQPSGVRFKSTHCRLPR